MTRSENMARVKSKNTKPEIFLRKLLWHKGFRYRLNYKELPGSPDLYIPKYRVAIFVNDPAYQPSRSRSDREPR